MVNKQVWMQCFGTGIPSQEILEKEVQRLLRRLESIQSSQASGKTSQSYSRLLNTLRRHQKMLAAVKDGQPWAWLQYPADDPLQLASKTTRVLSTPSK